MSNNSHTPMSPQCMPICWTDTTSLESRLAYAGNRLAASLARRACPTIHACEGACNRSVTSGGKISSIEVDWPHLPVRR